MTLHHVSSHRSQRSSSRTSSGIIKKGSSKISVPEGSRISVPEELIPALKKVRTADYLKFEAEINSWESEGPIMWKLMDRMLHRAWFEYFMGFIIVLNLIAMIIEIDRQANEDEVALRDVTHWTELFGWVALIIFVVELSARLLVYKWRFWQDSWNVFDFVIVTVDLISSLIGLVAGRDFPVSVIRIFRLAKLARAFKVLRVFPELRLLLAGLISSISAIFWGTVLLLFCILVWSLVAVLFIHPLNQELDYGDCNRCSRAYSTVFQSTLTFWQQIVTGDSWGLATIPVIEEYPATALYFILVYLSVGMAVTNLILGVVVSVAQQAQDTLQEEDNAERALFKLEQHTNLLKICKEMDTDGDGQLTKSEVYTAFNAPGEFRDSVLALDISEDDFDIVWKILDTDQKGCVSYKELVSRLSTLKVSDMQFMLAYIKYYMTQLRLHLTETMSFQHQEAIHADTQIEQVEEAILKEVAVLKRHASSLEDRHCAEIDELRSDRPTNGCVNAEINSREEEPGNSDTNHGTTPASCDTNNAVSPTTSRSDPNHGAKPASADAEHAVKTASMDSDTQKWLEQIHQEIAALQLRMEEQFKDMSRKLEEQALPNAAADLDIKGSIAQPELLVVPSRGSSTANASLPMCCKSWVPAERQVLEIPLHHGWDHHAVSTHLPSTPAIVRR